MVPGGVHESEPHGGSLTARLNWLRAGVLGANDGIISTAGLVIGVAAATTDAGEIATAGFAGLVAGAVSMALGEYVSVSTQRDTERALIDKERKELQAMPAAEHAELVELLRRRGLSDATSVTVADELTEHDALQAHLDVELGIDQQELANPWAAAGSSAVAFASGAVVPLVAILASPASRSWPSSSACWPPAGSAPPSAGRPSVPPWCASCPAVRWRWRSRSGSATSSASPPAEHDGE